MHCISTDFDNTLTKPIFKNNLWIDSYTPNLKVIQHLKEHIVDISQQLFVITSRDFSKENQEHISRFMDLYIAFPFKLIFSTPGMKYKFILKHNIELHYDDNIYELIQCLNHNINCIYVPHPYDLSNNSSSQSLTNQIQCIV